MYTSERQFAVDEDEDEDTGRFNVINILKKNGTDVSTSKVQLILIFLIIMFLVIIISILGSIIILKKY
jgi:hypothetical protein